MILLPLLLPDVTGAVEPHLTVTVGWVAELAGRTSD
jgi:hypothetical protein